ncbi:MAG TPA: hypothetical protein VE177_03650, partial [Candidatus Binatus sp.]|nr:hypothetical protein [Candidatus Binatus sp.]
VKELKICDNAYPSPPYCGRTETGKSNQPEIKKRLVNDQYQYYVDYPDMDNPTSGEDRLPDEEKVDLEFDFQEVPNYKIHKDKGCRYFPSEQAVSENDLEKDTRRRARSCRYIPESTK